MANTYTFHVSSSSTGSGTFGYSGSQTGYSAIKSGSTVTIYGLHSEVGSVTAVANSGSEFSGWSNNGTKWYATFTKTHSSITVSAGDGGSVSPSGTASYRIGSSLAISADPDDYYHFSSWNDGGAKDHSITVPSSDTTYTASFAKNEYTMTFDGNGGTPSQTTQTAAWGSTLKATATRSGYRFLGWYNAKEGGQKYTVVLKANATLYAHWKKQYTVSVAVATGTSLKYGTGTVNVTGTDATGTHSSDSSITVDEGTSVTISCQCERYNYFDHWYEENTYVTISTTPYTYSNLNKNLSYKCTFYRYETTLKFLSGSSIVGTWTVYSGRELDSPAPNPVNTSGRRMYFEGYYDEDGKQYFNDSQVKVVNIWDKEIEGSYTLTAKWTPIYRVYLPYPGDTTQGIKYIYERSGVAWYSDEKCKYKITKIDIPPVGDENKYRFDGYTETSSASSTKKITRTGFIIASLGTITADTSWYLQRVEIVGLTFDVDNDDHGYLSGTYTDGEGTFPLEQGFFKYDINSVIKVKPVRKTGWEFKNWMCSPTGQSSTTPEITITATTDLRGYKYLAMFSILKFYISVEDIDLDHGKLSGGNAWYQEGTSCRLNAVIRDFRYTVENWKRSPLSTSSWSNIPDVPQEIVAYSFNVFEEESKYKYTASYKRYKYAVNVSNEDDDLGEVYGSGYYKVNTYAELIANPLNGSEFLGWYDESGVRQSTSPRWQYKVVAKDVKFIAKFKIKITPRTKPNGTKYTDVFVIKPSSDDEGGEDHLYNYGSWFSWFAVTPDPTKGKFLYWLVDGVKFSSGHGTSCFFTVTKRSAVIAVFESYIGDYTVTVACNRPDHATCAGSGKYDKGEIIQISCFPDQGWTLVQWSDGKKGMTTRTVTVTGDADYVAEIESGKFEKREDDWGIDESVWYLPRKNSHGLEHLELGYNDYSSYNLNPITNYVYRMEYPESGIDILNSNCTWYAAGRTMEISNCEYSGCTGMAACNWFTSAYTNVNGEYWEREGYADWNNHIGETIENISPGDILCYDEYDGNCGHVEIVEDVDYVNRTVSVSFGWYKLNPTREERCFFYTHDWPIIGKGGGGYNWWNMYFQGVIHNPLLSTGGQLTTIRMYAAPEEAGSAYVNGAQYYSGKVGDKVTLSYIENDGNHFREWWDGQTGNDREYTITKSESLYAYFNDFDPAKNVVVTVEMIPSSIGTITGNGVYNKGDTVVLEYSLLEESLNYEFDGWYVDNELVGSDYQYIIESIKQNTHVVAKFHSTEDQPDPTPAQDFMTLYGDSNEIELKKIEFNLGVYLTENGMGREYVRPALKIIVGGSVYKTYSESTDLSTISLEFSTPVKTSDIQIVINKDYSSSKNSVVVNSLLIEYYGWDDEYGENVYTRYYDGKKWTQWVKET